MPQDIKENTPPSQDDISRIAFWLFKRHTSYTAWKRAAEAFFALYDAMAMARPEFTRELDLARAQHPEHPYGPQQDPFFPDIPPGKPWEDWPMWDVFEDTYAELEVCLGKLRHGDKSVLMDSQFNHRWRETFSGSMGFVEDYYYDFVGMHPRDGLGDPIPHIPNQDRITRLAQRAAALFVENIELSETWALRYRNYIPNHLSWRRFIFTAIAGPPKVRADKRADTLYPIPANLPPLPKPPLFADKPAVWWNPTTWFSLEKPRAKPYTVRSGRIMRRSGIYADLTDNGLYYSPAGQGAPFREGKFNEGVQASDIVPCTWTLIWEDTRYEDGTIPEEEKLYFPEPDEPYRPDGPDVAATDIPRDEWALPGALCPKSGRWIAPRLERSQRWIDQGEIMPGAKVHHMGTIVWYWETDHRSQFTLPVRDDL